MDKKILGVLGGMGPAASARFYAMLTEFTKAEREQEHMELLLLSVPSTPDRTEHILGRGESSPLPAMQKAIFRLAASGAQVIAVPCNTAEYFLCTLRKSSPVPILSIVRESAMLAAKRGVRKLGILATEGALRAGIYQCALTPLGMDFALPCAETQAEISELIYSRIKKSLPAENGVLEKAKSELRVLGCDAAVLGCTELSLVKTEDESFFIDSLAVLAAASVRACGYPLSEVGKAFT